MKYDYIDMSSGKVCDKINDAFVLACLHGDLNRARELAEHCYLNVRMKCDQAFHEACVNNRVNILEWLHEVTSNTSSPATVGGMNVEVKVKPYDYAEDFDGTAIDVCSRGHLPVMEWLYKHGLPLHYNQFYTACTSGNIDLVRWLYRKSKRFNHMYKDRWTPSLSSSHRDLDKYLNTVFRDSLLGKHYPVVKWLHRIMHQYNCTIDTHTLFYEELSTETMHYLFGMEITPEVYHSRAREIYINYLIERNKLVSKLEAEVVLLRRQLALTEQ